jgi:hypothetical protein
MNAAPDDIKNILHSLAETPRYFASICRELDDNLLNLRPDKKSWSANDILAHLRACADVWGETIAAMLNDDNPTLPHISPRKWIRNTDYLNLPFQESLDEFTEQRRKLLSTLNHLDYRDWSRGALINQRRHTVFSQARRMAKHEIIHCEQIEELMNPMIF